MSLQLYSSLSLPLSFIPPTPLLRVLVVGCRRLPSDDGMRHYVRAGLFFRAETAAPGI